VTNLELSTQYEAEAAQLLQAAGMTGRVHRRHLDIAADPDAVEPADVVVLHRVVCCYPDAQGLLGAAAHHARRLLVFSYPPVNPVTRIGFWSENLVRRVRGSSFRTYVHPPAALRAAAERDGLRVVHQHHAWDWDVLALAR
jgi:magnesium-protoporphyrin O-methyltransferase